MLKPSEDQYRRVAKVLAPLGWTLAVALTGVRFIWGPFGLEHAPVLTAVTVIFLAVSIAAHTVISRMKLSHTIVKAFEVGMEAAKTDREDTAEALAEVTKAQHDELMDKDRDGESHSRSVA
jgi:hypothetical protein